MSPLPLLGFPIRSLRVVSVLNAAPRFSLGMSDI